MVTILIALLNCIGAIFAGGILYGVGKMFKWGAKVDDRLERIEKLIEETTKAVISNGASNVGTRGNVDSDTNRGMDAE
jgi:hypothetical protein